VLVQAAPKQQMLVGYLEQKQQRQQQRQQQLDVAVTIQPETRPAAFCHSQQQSCRIFYDLLRDPAGVRSATSFGEALVGSSQKRSHPQPHLPQRTGRAWPHFNI
jgi:hypothetical protein